MPVFYPRQKHKGPLGYAKPVTKKRLVLGVPHYKTMPIRLTRKK